MITQLNNIGCLLTWDSNKESMEKYYNVSILIEDDIIIDISNSTKKHNLSFDCEDMLVSPGFIDSHTHPIFYSGRQDEYAQRLSGKSYQEITVNGGGINSSVDELRRFNKNDLVKVVEERMDTFLKYGTTTIEAKSGYGLSIESELKSLEVIKEVSKNHQIDIIPTFMGAHAFPPEFSDDQQGYIDLICDQMIPAVAKQNIAKFCDVFCEMGYFDITQTEKILYTAIDYGLIPRIHADEFQDSGAAELAGRLGCVSADHLMAVSDKGIQSLAQNSVIATLLPGTTFFLGSKNYAPARKLIEAGVDIALATDYNPGSSHIQSMPFILVLACLYLKMSIEEAIKASTWQGAVSLDIDKYVGSIEIGKKADIIIWNIKNPIDIVYSCPGGNIKKVLKNGKIQ